MMLESAECTAGLTNREIFSEEFQRNHDTSTSRTDIKDRQTTCRALRTVASRGNKSVIVGDMAFSLSSDCSLV